MAAPPDAQVESRDSPLNPVPSKVMARPYGPDLPMQIPTKIAGIDFSEPVTTLTQAIERAYWTNPTLLAERASTKAADYRMAQADAQFGPRLDYELNHGYRRDNLEIIPGAFTERSGWSSTAAAILSQPVYTFGRLTANRRQALADRKFQDESLKLVEQEILFTAMAAYVAVLRDRNGLIIARDNRDLLAREFTDTELRYKVREATVVDLRQVETRLEFAAADLLAAEGVLAASEAQFLAVVGTPAGELAPPNPLGMPATSFADAQELVLELNPLIAAAHAREQASRAAVAGAIAERLPRIDLKGRADYSPISAYDNDRRQTSLVGQVVISGPLFDGGAIAARVAEAEAINDGDWRLIDRARREVQAELSSSWARWQTRDEALGNLTAAVGAAEQAYEGVLLQQRAGFVTTLDVLILARELLTARTSLNATAADAYIAKARTLLALGALDLGYLLPAHPRYDAQEKSDALAFHASITLFNPVFRTIDALGFSPVRERPSRDLGTAGEVPNSEAQ